MSPWISLFNKLNYGRKWTASDTARSELLACHDVAGSIS
jgi:hypothetical protein